MTQPDPRPDPRLHPWREDLAAAHLKGMVQAPLYAEGAPMQVADATAPLRKAPDCTRAYETELLYGEVFEVYELKAGWAWGQARRDGYVGFLRAEALVPRGPKATHRIKALRSFLYPAAGIKATPRSWLPMGADMTVLRNEGDFVVTPGGYVYAAHVAPLGEPESDPVSVAERFLGTPYLWGGKSSLGLDCSALVQSACHACGLSALRDSDMQELALGEAIAIPATPDQFERGDLLFWPGHVAIAQGQGRMIHANAHFMEVTSEAIAPALARIAAKGSVLRTVRRLARPPV